MVFGLIPITYSLLVYVHVMLTRDSIHMYKEILQPPGYTSRLNHIVIKLPVHLLLALYLPYMQGLFTMTNNGNFTTCTTLAMVLHMHMSTAVCVNSIWCVHSYGGKHNRRTACA